MSKILFRRSIDGDCASEGDEWTGLGQKEEFNFECEVNKQTHTMRQEIREKEE